MEIYELDNIDININKQDVDSIVSDGITLRSGNKLFSFSVVEENILPDDDIKKEYQEKVDSMFETMKREAQTYKDQLKQAFDLKNDILTEKISEYKEKIKDASPMPEISTVYADKGLSVAKSEEGLKWYFNCVYAPKYINNKIIDPAFAKRLMTPITIEITTNNEDKVTNIRVLKIIGHTKFRHYHSLSSTSDCWGDFKYAGEVIGNADKALIFATKVLLLLETINEYSLGTSNPKGLSRFSTLKKHIIEDSDVSDENKKSTINSRNERSGFGVDVNDEISRDMVWST